jgi:hypothetical protein
MAICAVTLHATLAGFAPARSLSQSLPDDPFAITCLTAGHQAATDSSGIPDTAGDAACDRCILCGVAVSASTPADVAVDFLLRPTRSAHVLAPADALLPPATASNPRLSQGPPRIA